MRKIVISNRIFEREELIEIRERAISLSKTPYLDWSWKHAYEELAHAACSLDAFQARCTIPNPLTKDFASATGSSNIGEPHGEVTQGNPRVFLPEVPELEDRKLVYVEWDEARKMIRGGYNRKVVDRPLEETFQLFLWGDGAENPPMPNSEKHVNMFPIQYAKVMPILSSFEESKGLLCTYGQLYSKQIPDHGQLRDSSDKLCLAVEGLVLTWAMGMTNDTKEPGLFSLDDIAEWPKMRNWINDGHEFKVFDNSVAGYYEVILWWKTASGPTSAHMKIPANRFSMALENAADDDRMGVLHNLLVTLAKTDVKSVVA